jgi:sugar phosphate isomerase/epimerase
MNGIVGYSGFVGSNLLQYYIFDNFYNSKNFEKAINKHFDVLFFCGLPAVKWYANKNPDEDYNNIENIKNILNTITCNKFILISTVDVYEATNNNLLNEDYDCNYDKNHTYGKHRYLFEKYISNKFENYHIIRLPALFGKGLKKNIIYDLINNNQIDKIPYYSSLQWYDLNRLKNDIEIVIKNNIKICNFFTEPLDTKDIIKVFSKVYNINYDFQIEYLNSDDSFNKKIIYNICTKYSKLFGSNLNNYICDKNEVLDRIEEFLNYTKLDKTNLCVSNICVNKISQLQFAYILKLYGITNIQIAPTKLIDWNNIDKLDLSLYKKCGLNVYAFQSITYTLNDLNIFSSTQDKLLKHLKQVIDCAVKNKVQVLVFGCPRNRKIIDVNIDNKSIFIDFFKIIGDYCSDKNIIICLENNSKKYNCNFINTIDECAYLVRKINKKNIKMMVDLGNAVMENDDWYYLKEHIDIIYNIDISQQNMKDFVNVHESNSIFNFILKKNNYNKMINLEMLINNSDDELNILNKSISNFIQIYQN